MRILAPPGVSCKAGPKTIKADVLVVPDQTENANQLQQGWADRD